MTADDAGPGRWLQRTLGWGKAAKAEEAGPSGRAGGIKKTNTL